MTPKNQIKKAHELTTKGEVRLIYGEKVLLLPCIEPEYKPKAKRGKRWLGKNNNNRFKRQA